jgi:SAM-dependent methyltransferase
MAKALAIREGERVLEIGGGDNPFCRADVLVDVDFQSGRHRDGGAIRKGALKQQYVQADLAALPFRDKSFDVVVCIQVLEHVDDPGPACEELMRVAHRGFMETPRKWTEYYAGHPTHQWLVDEFGGRLIFEPVLYDSSPFLNFALSSLWKSPELVKRARTIYSHIPCIQMAWKDRFSYEIRGQSPVAFSAENQTVALRHYHFARNLLVWAAPPAHGLYHAACAEQMAPGNAACVNLHLFYRILCWKWPLKGSLSLRRLFVAFCAFLSLKISRRFEIWYHLLTMNFFAEDREKKEGIRNNGG